MILTLNQLNGPLLVGASWFLVPTRLPLVSLLLWLRLKVMLLLHDLHDRHHEIQAIHTNLNPNQHNSFRRTASSPFCFLQIGRIGLSFITLRITRLRTKKLALRYLFLWILVDFPVFKRSKSRIHFDEICPLAFFYDLTMSIWSQTLNHSWLLFFLSHCRTG